MLNFFYLSYPKIMHKKLTTKKNLKKWIFLPIIFLVWICSYLIINARELIFPDISDSNDNLKWRFSWIHFTSLWNDFGGWVFWEVWDINSEMTQIILWSNVKCWKQQARWLYYNDARWARIWPLDQKTLDALKKTNPSYADLTMTWWFYRDCDKNKEMVIHWAIKYTLNDSVSWLIAWVKLDYYTNSYTGEFAENLQFFNNKTPIGYIWDSYGGIWFIWWKLAWTWCANLLNYLNTWSVQETFYLNELGAVMLNDTWTPNCEWTAANGDATDMWNLLIQWNTILSTTISSWEKTALLWSLQEKTVLLSSTDINSATVMNAAKKNASTLCRGKTIMDPILDKNINTAAGEYDQDVLCYENAPDLELDLGDWEREDKTIVVNSGNVTIINTMTWNTPAIDLFVDRWNVYLEKLWAWVFTNFNIQGFPDSSSTPKNQWRFFRGNIFINGLLLWGSPWNIEGIRNKFHIHGKFVSLNTPLTLSDGRKAQVEDVLWTSIYNDRIPFKKTLAWECFYNGEWTDNTPCWGSWSNITSIPFVVLDWNFSSKLIK